MRKIAGTLSISGGSHFFHSRIVRVLMNSPSPVIPAATQQEELNDLQKACGGDLPPAVLDDFYRDFDAEKAAQTDGSFMDGVLRFYQEASS